MLVCLKCGSNNLYHYTERTIAIHHAISKVGRITKKVIAKRDATYSSPDHIDCEECGQEHDYERDSIGRIKELHLL